MSRFARNLFVLAALVAGCAQAAADDTRTDNYFARARQFVRALYPGLSYAMNVTIHDRHRLDEPDTGNMFSIELNEPDKGPTPPDLVAGGRRYRIVEPGACDECYPCQNPLLSIEFVFDWQTEMKDLYRAWVGGPFVHCRVDKLEAEVKKHPLWPDSRILAELKNAGAKFGPDRKAEFLRELPIDKLKPFVGEIEVTSTDFQVRELTWLVRAKWHSPDGRLDADCFLVFEPFEGKLIQFDRDSSLHQTPEK